MPRLAETALLTSLALVAFASNSILTRMALGSGLMDAATFTTARLAAGALVLGLLVRLRGGPLSWSPPRGRALVGAMALAILRGSVLVRLRAHRCGSGRVAAVRRGPDHHDRLGHLLRRAAARAHLGRHRASSAGLAWLTLPSVGGRPDPIGSALMVVAGCAWGVYSLAGKGATDVLEANARSFIWALPAAMFLNVIVSSSARASGRGLLIALIAGGITSGLGYAIWYRALRGSDRDDRGGAAAERAGDRGRGRGRAARRDAEPAAGGRRHRRHRRRELGLVAACAAGARRQWIRMRRPRRSTRAIPCDEDGLRSLRCGAGVRRSCEGRPFAQCLSRRRERGPEVRSYPLSRLPKRDCT